MLLKLKCAYQNYAWGKVGLESTVAKLLQGSNDELEIIEDNYYAELWMGTHPNGPSLLHESSQKLSDYIVENPSCLGDNIIKRFGKNLPFLFKVLSVRTALSIQAHPDKKRAEELHASRPDLYKDDNHKPEMAIALTPFEVLCGFRPIEEIKYFLNCLPELQTVVGKKNADALINAESSEIEAKLKTCFSAMMNAPQELITQQLDCLLKKVLDNSERNNLLMNLLMRLNDQYPNDVGCFGIYFFNYITLQPGEAIFLGPNEPHAYIFGDCVECMACSDNVVRAGLTPKYKDVDTLCEMLSYKPDSLCSKYFKPKRISDCIELFNPPIPDFTVIKYTLEPGDFILPAEDSASIIIIIEGSLCYQSHNFSIGSVFFLGANNTAKIYIESKIIMFRACCKL